MHKDTDVVKTCEQALELSKEGENDPLIATSHTYLAVAYNELGNKSEALKNLNQSKKINENGNNQDGLGMITGMIANHFLETGDLDSAMHYIKESFKIHEQLGNKSQVLQNISFMAGLDLQKGDTESAMGHLDHSMDIAKEIKDGNLYDTLFVDSISVASRLCYKWAEQQPDAQTKGGTINTMKVYGQLRVELVSWATHLQHIKNKNVKQSKASPVNIAMFEHGFRTEKKQQQNNT